MSHDFWHHTNLPNDKNGKIYFAIVAIMPGYIFNKNGFNKNVANIKKTIVKEFQILKVTFMIPKIGNLYGFKWFSVQKLIPQMLL